MRTQDRGHDGQAGVGFGAACVAHAEHLEGWEADWVFAGHFGCFFLVVFFFVGGRCYGGGNGIAGFGLLSLEFRGRR